MSIATSEADTVVTMDPDELRSAARRLLSDFVDRRAGWNSDYRDTSALKLAMVEQGWHLVSLPDAVGGLGQGIQALAPLYEEQGRSLSPVTLASTLAAADAFAIDGRSDELAAIAAGDMIVAVSVQADSSEGLVEHLVQDAGAATHLLLLHADAATLHALGDATVRTINTWDRSRSFCRVILSDADTIPVSASASARARAHIYLAQAWDCVGGIGALLGETFEYLKTRQQFGRPIGSFQALKHRAADLQVEYEIARSLTQAATLAYAYNTRDFYALAGQAKLFAAQVYRTSGEEAIQLHGGIGVTWEHDCHLFLKRAMAHHVLPETPHALADLIAPGVYARINSAA